MAGLASRSIIIGAFGAGTLACRESYRGPGTNILRYDWIFVKKNVPISQAPGFISRNAVKHGNHSEIENR